MNNDVDNDHALRVEKALAVLQEYKRTHRIEYFKPNSDQRGFYNCGCENMFREFKDSDRKRRIQTLAVEVAFHLTGVYPDWWPGKRLSRPAEVLCMGVSNQLLRDNLVNELLGSYEGRGKFDGNGLIRQDQVYQVKPSRVLIRLPHSVVVRHKTGDSSKVLFQPITKDASDSDLCWIDHDNAGSAELVFQHDL